MIVGRMDTFRFIVLMCLLQLPCTSTSLHAQSFTWDGATNDDFNIASNWTGGLVPNGALNVTLSFGNEGGGGNYIVNNLDSVLTDIANLRFDAANGSYQLNGAGLLQLSDGGALDNDSGFDQVVNVDIAGSGSSILFDTDFGLLTLNGNLDLSDTGGVNLSFVSIDDGIINGDITGAGGSITKLRNTTLFLNGNNTFTGPLTITQGEVQLNGNLADSIAVSLGTSGTALFNLNGNDETIGSLSGGGAAGGNVSLGGATLTIQDNGASTYNGVISGAGGLTFDGTGSLNLTNTNTFTGPLTILGGTVQLDGSLSNSTAVILANAAGALLDLNDNDETIGALSGGGANGGDVDLGSATLTFNQNSSTTYGGTISGTGGLVMDGSGTLNLSGTNTFTGPLDIQDGTIQLDGDLVDSIAVTLSNVAGANLDLNGNDETIGSINGGGGLGGNIQLGNATLTIQDSGASTYGGVISGTGGLTFDGTGSLNLTGSNTFTGALTILDGTIQLDGDLANTVSVNLANTAGALLDLNDNDETIGSLSGGGNLGGDIDLGSATLTFNQNSSTTYGGVISGTGGLVMDGSGTLNLSGTNTFTGPLDIQNGTIQLDGSLVDSIAVTLSNTAGANLDLNGNDETIGSINGGGGLGGNIQLGNATLTIEDSGASTYGGVISGTGGLTFDGTDSLNLTGNNTFTGALSILDGTVQLDGNLSNSTDVILANSAGVLFDLNDNDETIGSLSGGGGLGGNVDLGSATLTFNQNINTTYAGVISGTGGLVMNGSGILNLTGTHIFTGSLDIQNGTIQLDGSLVDSIAVTLSNTAGANLDLNGNDETIASLSGGGANGGNVSLGAGSLTINETGTSTYAGQISGSGGVTLDGAGQLNLDGTNTFTGPLSIDNGTLQLNGSIANTTAVILADAAGAILDLSGGNETIGSLRGGGANGGNVLLGSSRLTINENGSTSYDGVISGSGGVTMDGNGTTTWSGSHAFTGTLAINNGTVRLDGNLDDSVLVSLNNAAGVTFDLNGNDETIGGLVGGGVNGGTVQLGAAQLTIDQVFNTGFAGVITGSGGLTLEGGRLLLLSGTNTFTGPLNINDGTLVLMGDLDDTVAVNLANAGGALFDLSDNDETIGTLSGGGLAGGGVDLGAATLTIKENGTSTYGGVIRGSGGLILDGTGTMNLSGSNTFTGPMSIQSGTLQLDGDLVNSITIDLANVAGALLDLNDNDEMIGSLIGGGALGGNVDLGSGFLTTNDIGNTLYAGAISGTGGLTLGGSGILELTGNNPFTGLTRIDDGQLVLNGSVGGNVDVNPGARLSGTGTVGGTLTLGNGATLAPGNSIGTLVVAGDYVQQTGSTLEVELDGILTDSDLLDVTGGATLESNSQIVASISGKSFISHGDLFPIIQADGGVVDLGAQISTVSVTLKFLLMRDLGFNNGDLVYALVAGRVSNAFSNPADPGNNMEVGLALDRLIPKATLEPTSDIALLMAQLDTLTLNPYNQALHELSPETNQVVTSLGIRQTNQFFNTLAAHLSSQRRGRTDVGSATLPFPSGALASLEIDPAL
ncbi:MAG: autotransporter-associated beta strand repeat-containing protein, partial [Planctomycetota bacterium]|nr:autotransporter-associated beta strand repeat-containing protein [Planctomycetota bacterium]